MRGLHRQIMYIDLYIWQQLLPRDHYLFFNDIPVMSRLSSFLKNSLYFKSEH